MYSGQLSKIGMTLKKTFADASSYMGDTNHASNNLWGNISLAVQKKNANVFTVLIIKIYY